MTDKTWLGTTTNYDDGSNWTPFGVPTTGDTAIFGVSGANKTIGLLSASVNADEWLFTGGAYDIQLNEIVRLGGAGIVVNGGSALIETFSGGDIIFLNHSSAGTATLHAHSFGGFITFEDNSDASGARIIADLGSTVDFSLDAGPLGNGNFAGSIEGAGQFAIGGRSLTVGGNNLSTTVSGTITARTSRV
jgi:hypothetical protein